jgi:hypothetical protein
MKDFFCNFALQESYHINTLQYMKRFLMLLAVAALAVGAVSCQKEIKHETPASVALYTHPAKPEPASAGKRAVTVTATVDGWSVQSKADWITVSLAQGMEYTRGVREVILTFTENTSTSPRSGDVVFSAGSYSETYTLTQEGAAPKTNN